MFAQLIFADRLGNLFSAKAVFMASGGSLHRLLYLFSKITKDNWFLVPSLFLIVVSSLLLAEESKQPQAQKDASRSKETGLWLQSLLCCLAPEPPTQSWR